MTGKCGPLDTGETVRYRFVNQSDQWFMVRLYRHLLAIDVLLLPHKAKLDGEQLLFNLTISLLCGRKGC